ncbi:MAG: hypothetical protein ACLFUJ_03730 [Phycisphaerae bacterium]
MTRTRKLQIVWIALAGLAFVAGGMMQDVVDERMAAYDLQPPERAVAQNHPELALLTVAPGPLRAPMVNYFWIRAQELKDEGRYYEANQLAEIICILQSRSPGVWAFHSWNMAWNISAAVKTAEERWLWVNNGLELLRDRGIPLNPRSFLLYRELAWIFFNKIGGNLDEMHGAYKSRFAQQMNAVLGAPPAGTTEEVIEAFRKIAQAPLDRDPTRPRSDGQFQTDVLKEQILQVDPEAAELAERLKELKISIDRSLLAAYRRWSEDPNVTLTVDLMNRREPENDYEKTLSELINSPDFADARASLIAWVRSQILWNTYKMDPQLMLELMENPQATLGGQSSATQETQGGQDLAVPIDWRLPWPHGLYWSAMGFRNGQDLNLSDIHPLNTQRILLNSLKDLTAMGRLSYVENPADPENPMVLMLADVRYVWPTHLAHVEFIELYLADQRKSLEPHEDPATWKDNVLRSGHINFLKDQMLHLALRFEWKQVGELWDFIKEKYDPQGPEWNHTNPVDAVVAGFRGSGKPTSQQANMYVHVAIQTALLQAATGNPEGYQTMMRDFALKIYAAYHTDSPERVNMPRFALLALDELPKLLLAPRQAGVYLTMDQRSTLWKFASLQDVALRDQGPVFKMTSVIYDRFYPALARQAEQFGRDPEKLFPPPPDLERYREWRKQQPRSTQTGPTR